MSDRVVFLTSAVVVACGLSAVSLPSVAQGLRGAPKSQEIQGRLVYVKGETDEERWKNFLALQPKLVGKKLSEIDAALCGQIQHKDMTEVEYGLTKQPVSIGKSKSFLHIRVFFKDGVAYKYSVVSEN